MKQRDQIDFVRARRLLKENIGVPKTTEERKAWLESINPGSTTETYKSRRRRPKRTRAKS